MLNNISIGNMLNAIVPISRFNKGEANKIFEEVNKSGYKIVVKNNKPTCVLITPETYQEMIETIENYYLFIEADKRMKTVTNKDLISSDEVLSSLGVTREKLSSLEDVEIE